MRIRDSLDYLLLSIYIEITLLVTQGSSEINHGRDIPCREGGFCVPIYLCSNDTIITDGSGLIDLRFSEKDCPGELICCQEAVSFESQLSECHGTCVSLFQCLDDVYEDTAIRSSVLDIDKINCPDNLICCKNVRQPPAINVINIPIKHCQGKCVPIDQCSVGKLETFGKDIINLRFSDDGCGGDELVCCMETVEIKPNIEVPKVCEGTCVPFYQCTNGKLNTAGEGLIDLRSFDDACPGELVCCNTKPMAHIEVPNLCNGTCVPFYQCSNGVFNSAGKGIINLRSVEPSLRSSDETCPGELVCCRSKIESNIEESALCVGTCVPFYQCANGTFNSAGEGLINLRSFDDACPGELVCCSSRPESNIEIPKICNGTCVPFYQCANGTFNSAGEGLINLRSFDDACPGELVCCSSKSEQISSTCKCLPFNECLDGSGSVGGKSLLDLRISDGDCSKDQVCCSNPKPKDMTTVTSNECKESCVPSYQCMDGTLNMDGKDILDLRFNSCPENLVCCKVKPESNIPIKRICKGTCVSLYQCNMAGQRVSNWSYEDCPGNKICCDLSTKEEQLEIDFERPTSKRCDRACVPLAQCGDSPQTMITQLVDIRLGSTYTGCLDGDVCCTNPIKFTPDAMKWMDWINDINNMVGMQNVGKVGKCSLNIVRNVESIKEDEIPWLVTVWKRHPYSREMQDKYLCVGTLVKTGVVLVPADCIHGNSNAPLFVRTGDYNLKAKGGFEEFQIIRHLVHPDYDNENNLNNVALLFLTNRIINKLDEVCMFKLNEQIRKQDCLIAGWNNLDLLNVRNPFTIPKKYNLQLKTTKACRPGYFCTGRSQSIEGCDKLHGSPLICLDQSGYSWKIAGMVVKNNVRCDQSGIPDSLLEVTHLEPWVREQLSPSFVQKPAVHEPSRYYLPGKP